MIITKMTTKNTESSQAPSLKKESSLVFASKKESSQAPPSKKEFSQVPPSKKEPSQGDGGCGGGIPPPPSGGPQPGATAPNNAPGPPDHLHSRAGNTVLKSGPLFISSKGIGWTSWKKRWFILTRTSLVFFRSDPSAIPQKGSEVNLTLGGIDLNNSGSVEIKADKKLLTVLFPDGRDGRAFTLKAETLEDLHEWKAALENALAQAPSAAHIMGQNGILRNDQADAVDGSLEQTDNKQQPGKSVVIGRPILLALEEVDGTPSFLEKALRFVEDHGVKTEGILRQAADVDDVERRIREYEQGKTEFSPGEDAHVIADCVKYVIRELPSSPVPASCCNALLEACRTDRGGRLNAMRYAICETFPEPNRRLLQRILLMMQTVASHKAENRMSSSAVAACMAPLLLRPLLSGDCEIENDFDVGGDGSVQLLQAAAAANHAQAIVITLLEDYDSIFGEGAVSPDLYSNTEDSGSQSEEATDDDDDESYDDDDDDDDDATQESDAYTDDDLENGSAGTNSESGDSIDNELADDKGSDDLSSGSKSTEVGDDFKVSQESPKSPPTLDPQHDVVKISENISNQSGTSSAMQANQSAERLEDIDTETSSNHELIVNSLPNMQKSITMTNGPVPGHKRNTVWGRTSAKKNLSMESIDFPIDNDNEEEIQMLEATKLELQNRIAEEVKGNAVLEANLEHRRKALLERRLALEKDVKRLEEQLQKEREKRKAMEAGLETYDEKTKAMLEEIAQAEVDVINLKQRVDNLSIKLTQQMDDSCNQAQQTAYYPPNQKIKQDKEATATSHLTGRSTSKDTCLDGAETANEKKKGSTSLQNKPPRQKQQLDPVHYSSSQAVNSSATEPVASKLNTSTSSKRSGTKDGGPNSTTSALTKLTTRLNFLKERRSQIANELQNMDKGQGSGQASEMHSTSNPEKGRRSDSSHPAQNLGGGMGTESPSVKYAERFRNPDSLSGIKMLDEGKRSESQNPHILERGRSEGHVSYNADKDIGFGGPPRFPSRTFSR